MVAVVFAMAAIGGCGGGAHEPEEEIAHAYQREESAKVART
jgi:hypothetical protein